MDIIDKLYEVEHPTCDEAIKEIQKLRCILVSVTHHPGALEEYKSIWLPIVQEELKKAFV